MNEHDRPQKFEYLGFAVRWSGWLQPPNRLAVIGHWTAFKAPDDMRVINTDEFGPPSDRATPRELDELKEKTKQELLKALGITIGPHSGAVA